MTSAVSTDTIDASLLLSTLAVFKEGDFSVRLPMDSSYIFALGTTLHRGPFLRRKSVVTEGLKNRCEHSRFHLCEVKAQCLVS